MEELQSPELPGAAWAAVCSVQGRPGREKLVLLPGSTTDLPSTGASSVRAPDSLDMGRAWFHAGFSIGLGGILS